MAGPFPNTQNNVPAAMRVLRSFGGPIRAATGVLSRVASRVIKGAILGTWAILLLPELCTAGAAEEG